MTIPARHALFCLLIALFVVGCSGGALRPNLPPLTISDPNLLGLGTASIRAVKSVDDALVCLAARQPVYGLIVANSNVRAEPVAEECRVGRIESGEVVRLDGAFSANQPTPIVSLDFPFLAFNTAQIGYEEDIQPIFSRSCNSCHSALIRTKGLQVTAYDPLMRGGENGAVIVPGNASASSLWELVATGRMPMVGELSDLDKETVRLWIDAGAPQRRGTPSDLSQLWFSVDEEVVESVENACEGGLENAAETLVNAELIQPISCGIAPDPETVAGLRTRSQPVSSAAPRSSAAPGPIYAGGASAAAVGIQNNVLGLSPPSDADGWLQSRGGFCVERRLPNLDKSVTALSFAPDGRLFIALDQVAGEGADPLILYDAFHPSRSIVVYDSNADTRPREIVNESPRITGLDYSGGSLWVSRAGEVGRVPDGGVYETLAGGFAVNSQLFHANNGIVVQGGWVYISAGGTRDGYSDGPLVGLSEDAALGIVTDGNGHASRIVRASVERLLSERTIGVFETAARGARNPYGITNDPLGRLWWTDNGATNVPDEISAGDEINLFDPRTATGQDSNAPYYGFPLALSNPIPEWYVDPVVALPNTAAPTAITWAYNTIFYGQYGRDPGLYRLGRGAGGQVETERVLLVWPLIALTTAPDGALWLGTGSDGLFRITPGCG